MDGPAGRRNIGRPKKRWTDQLHVDDQGTGSRTKEHRTTKEEMDGPTSFDDQGTGSRTKEHRTTKEEMGGPTSYDDQGTGSTLNPS